MWLTLATLALGVVAMALFVALSPTAYGDVAGGLFSSRWLSQLQTDAIINTPRFNDLFGIAPFVIYLGWRGLSLGAPPPRIEVTLRRFTISLAVVMVACLGALIVTNAMQAALQGALLTLLALDVFAGLAAAALARRGGGRESALGESGEETTRWLLTAFGAAALVIVISFAIGLAFNVSLFAPLLRAMGPVGVAVNAALIWLTTGLAYLLWIAFVRTIGAWLFQHTAFYVTAPKSVASTPARHPHHAVLAPPPAGFLIAATVIIGLVMAGVIVFLVYLAVRALLRSIRAAAEPEMDEEREALDARGLLRRQARDLLASLRRGSGAAERDPLTHGGARWLYRETLRAGAAAGIARSEGETADEYSRRLALAMQQRGAVSGETGLTALTQAYDDSRYGESAAQITPAASAEARQAISALGKLRGE